MLPDGTRDILGLWVELPDADGVPGGGSAQAKSFIWAQMTDGSGRDGTGPPIRLFAYSPSRSTKTAMELYAGIRPGTVLMTDCGRDPPASAPGLLDAPPQVLPGSVASPAQGTNAGRTSCRALLTVCGQ